jgi:enoyl-CoA hydratase
MGESVLLIESKDGVTVLTLNRPQAMNALSGELISALAKAFEGLAVDADTRVVILTGSGRAFCAGLDLNELSAQGPVSGTGLLDGEDLMTVMAGFDKPIIGAINGPAVTGGFELALACDILIASTKARFADTHARVGILPGWGLSQKLSRAIGLYRAKELSLTGNFLSAERAEAWGLVNRVVAEDELLPTCRELAHDMLSVDSTAQKKYKRLIHQGHEMSLSDGLALERQFFEEHLAGVSRDDLAEQRKVVIERGRNQKDKT